MSRKPVSYHYTVLISLAEHILKQEEFASMNMELNMVCVIMESQLQKFDLGRVDLLFYKLAIFNEVGGLELSFLYCSVYSSTKKKKKKKGGGGIKILKEVSSLK